MLTEKVERRARALSGLPRPVDHSLPWWKRTLRNRWFWIVVVLLIVYAAALAQTYLVFGAGLRHEIEAVTTELNSPTTLTWAQFNEALKGSVFWAGLTAVALVLVFLLIDRLRPTTWTMKAVALGWGACVATLVSLYLNTWMSSLINIQGPGDPTSSARAAIFVAPFVEEASKATVLFLLAMSVRYRIVSALQSVTLAGLSAVGFAFTENIIYYTRPFIYAAKITGVDPDAARLHVVQLRGLMTCFGHPLFTTMTAIGLAVALTHRSKLVRILAPLSGFLCAVTGHMLFNGMASFFGDPMPLVIGGWLGVLFVLIFLWRRFRNERKSIAARLDDYVRMGWLEPRDPLIFAHERARIRLAIAALLRGPGTFIATLALQRTITELAYLRAAMTRGTVDAIGDERARELLFEIRALRATALFEPDGLRIRPENWHLPRFTWLRERLARRRASVALPPNGFPSYGPGGQRAPLPVGQVPVLQPTTSGPTASYPQGGTFNR